MTRPERRRRVLIVDDSPLLRMVLAGALAAHPGLEVVGECADPYEARERIRQLQPDVVTLDVEMPRMDGLTFLRKLMKAHPLPVVMVSNLTARGTATAMEALDAGAVDVVGKPQGSDPSAVDRALQDLAETVYEASFARLQARPAQARPAQAEPAPTAPAADRALIAVGASTGGTEALRELLGSLPADLPPIVVVQHILPGFVEALAQRLDRTSALRVKVAADGERAEPGTAYFAPSGVHLAVAGPAGQLALALQGGERVALHQPSVDVLFRSVARTVGAQACGLILTGMGRDGAEGLLEMARAGAATLGQDPDSCVVYGMPKVAFELGAVQAQLPLSELAGRLVRWSRGG